MKQCDLPHVPIPLFAFYCEIGARLMRLLLATLLRYSLVIRVIRTPPGVEVVTEHHPGVVPTRLEQIVAFAFNGASSRVVLTPKPLLAVDTSRDDDIDVYPIQQTEYSRSLSSTSRFYFCEILRMPASASIASWIRDDGLSYGHMNQPIKNCK